MSAGISLSFCARSQWGFSAGHFQFFLWKKVTREDENSWANWWLSLVHSRSICPEPVLSLMNSLWAGNIAKTMTSNGKQFTVTREIWALLYVIAGISARFSNFAFVLFCCITNDWSLGEQWILFRSNLNVSRNSGNKIHCSPRDQSLSGKYFR